MNSSAIRKALSESMQGLAGCAHDKQALIEQATNDLDVLNGDIVKLRARAMMDPDAETKYMDAIKKRAELIKVVEQ